VTKRTPAEISPACPGFFLGVISPLLPTTTLRLSGFFRQRAHPWADASYSGQPIQKSKVRAQNLIHADTIQNRHKQKLQQTLSSNVFKEPDMNADQILMEIRETNLSYLMLAQSLIRTDREQALFRLGISEDTATMLGMLSPAQVMRIASSNTLLCSMRVDDDLVWSLLTNHGKSSNDSVTRLHANILMAGRHQEAA